MEISPGVRNAVRAVIVRGEAVLVQRKRYESGEIRFTLPGGAPETEETLEEGLRRECREEIGVDIEVGALMHVADFFKPRQTDPPSCRHLVEFLFRCEVPSTYEASNGPRPDRHQVGVEWLPLSGIEKSPLFPDSFRSLLSHPSANHRVYLGLVS